MTTARDPSTKILLRSLQPASEHLVATTMYVGLKRKLTPMQMDQYALNVAREMLKGPRLNGPVQWSIVQWAISLGTSRLKGRSSGQR
jgi:hypothetical protein